MVRGYYESQLAPGYSQGKDTQVKQVLTKSMNMDSWVIVTLNQLFKRGSHAQIKFSKR